MRYQNWDVLIFPERSKVPLQEFKTQCLVTQDHEHLQSPQFANIGPSPYYSNDGKPLLLLPVVTSFIGSLTHGDDFRVSIHSWERPKPSKALESVMQLDDNVMFEARIYLDGKLKSRSLFDHRTMWPFVVETADSERTGEPEPLRFPVFHAEILKQSHWDAGESYGRIKIVIAEGLCRDMRATDTIPPAFERFRDVVGFAFQHAPSNILEYSGIAWPNDVMWKQAQKLATQPGSYSHKSSVVPDPDAHAHSPRQLSLPHHATGPAHCYNDLRECAIRGCTHPRHFASPQHQMQGRPVPSNMYAGNMMSPAYAYNPGGRSAAGTVDDPFLVPSQPSSNSKLFQRKQAQSSSHDVPMSDCYGSGESRAVTDMSGVSYDRLDFERQVNNAAVSEILKALSPGKQSQLFNALSPTNRIARTGSMPPDNSPADGASIAPFRSGLVARDNVQSIYNDLDSVESGTDQSPTTSRTNSNDERTLPFTRARFGSASPANIVQSKKERDLMRKSVEQPAADRAATTETSASQNRSPLIESLNINRQRSNSAGSKRKRSNSKLDQVTSAEQSPSGGTQEVGSGTSIFSPYYVIDDDDTVIGSRRRTLPPA